MLAAFFMFVSRAVRMPWWGMIYLASGKISQLPRRFVLLLVIHPLFLILQIMHWIGFLMDELLFPGYRKVMVKRPVFIVGPPRSGTTLMQRKLALDSGFTTLRTWECLLAPSITERYFWHAMAKLLSPLIPLLRRHRPAFLHRLDRIHLTGLSKPEEDNLVLLPIFGTVLMFVFMPARSILQELCFFDRQVPAYRRRIIMEFYSRCVQKHLYFHGADRRYLSKNPTFSAMVESLAEWFPGARIVVCMRTPLETAPSVLSLLGTALHLAGRDMTPRFRDEALELQRFYYTHLQQVLPGVDPRAPVISMSMLKEQFLATVESLYENLGQPLTPEFRNRLAVEARAVRSHVSQHCYCPENFGLDHAALADYFVGTCQPENHLPSSAKSD